MGPLPLTSVNPPSLASMLPSHRARFGPSRAKPLLAAVRRRCQGLRWEAEARVQGSAQQKKNRRASAVSLCMAGMVAAVGITSFSQKALCADGVTSNGDKTSLDPKGRHVCLSVSKLQAGGRAELGRFPPRCRLGRGGVNGHGRSQHLAVRLSPFR